MRNAQLRPVAPHGDQLVAADPIFVTLFANLQLAKSTYGWCLSVGLPLPDDDEFERRTWDYVVEYLFTGHCPLVDDRGVPMPSEEC